jgi:hypothetical protein
MKKIIQTEYKTSLSTGAGYIIATAPWLGNVRVPYDHTLSGSGNHQAAAEALAAKHNLKLIEEVEVKREGNAWLAERI